MTSLDLEMIKATVIWEVFKLNIVDGMDTARFNSGNPHDKPKEEEAKKVKTKMPMVLRNLNNKSDVDSTSPQQAQVQMAQQPPLLSE
jgi:hypothetical protein